MRACVNNVNIRGCEARQNSKGEGYLLVRIEDETGKPYQVVDKVMERQSGYKRDTIGTLYIDIDMRSQWHNVRIVGFKPEGRRDNMV